MNLVTDLKEDSEERDLQEKIQKMLEGKFSHGSPYMQAFDAYKYSSCDVSYHYTLSVVQCHTNCRVLSFTCLVMELNRFLHACHSYSSFSFKAS